MCSRREPHREGSPALLFNQAHPQGVPAHCLHEQLHAIEDDGYGQQFCLIVRLDISLMSLSIDLILQHECGHEEKCCMQALQRVWRRTRKKSAKERQEQAIYPQSICRRLHTLSGLQPESCGNRLLRKPFPEFEASDCRELLQSPSCFSVGCSAVPLGRLKRRTEEQNSLS